SSLQADTDTVLEAARLDARVAIEHPHASAAAGAQAFEDFDGGSLASTVRTQQAEDLARAQFEIDALDSGEVAVTFVEGLRLNRTRHGTSVSHSRLLDSYG